jgi:hypothetical protein
MQILHSVSSGPAAGAVLLRLGAQSQNRHCENLISVLKGAAQAGPSSTHMNLQ